MQNRQLIAKAAARACALEVAPSARQTRALFRNELAKGYPEYDENQPRAADGTWGGGSGGGSSSASSSGESGWHRAGRYTLTAGALLAAAALGVVAAPVALRLARTVGLARAGRATRTASVVTASKLKDAIKSRDILMAARAKSAERQAYFTSQLAQGSPNRARVKELNAQIKRHANLQSKFDAELKQLERQIKSLRRGSKKRASLSKGYPEYDEDQPRGEGGKWTSGGGGGSSSAGTKEPTTPRDWSKLVGIVSDVALVAGMVAFTGPAGAASMVSAVTGRSIANLARTSVGRTAMTAASGIAASKVWGDVAVPLFRHISQAWGAVGLATAFESFKRMGGRAPSGMTWRKLAAKFGIARQKLTNVSAKITRAVRQAVASARRTMRTAMRTATAAA